MQEINSNYWEMWNSVTGLMLPYRLPTQVPSGYALYPHSPTTTHTILPLRFLRAITVGQGKEERGQERLTG